MGKYTIYFGSRVDAMLVRHVAFLARVSVPAAKRLRNEFARVLREIEENPYQFPVDTDLNLPEGIYRKALFARRYKALFSVVENKIFLDAVVDCRQDTSELF